jgi:hypothetical protein
MEQQDATPIDDARIDNATIKVSVTAPGRVGASKLDVECARCGSRDSRYVPRGTVSIEHACGDDWRVAAREVAAAG